MAGSWETIPESGGYKDGGSYTGIRELGAQFTADGSDASVPQLAVGGDADSGFIQRATVVFDATTPPTGASFTVQITDSRGVIIGNADGTALTASSNITVNAYYVGKLYISVSSNKTNSAKAKVYLYVR